MQMKLSHLSPRKQEQASEKMSCDTENKSNNALPVQLIADPGTKTITTIESEISTTDLLVIDSDEFSTPAPESNSVQRETTAVESSIGTGVLQGKPEIDAIDAELGLSSHDHLDNEASATIVNNETPEALIPIVAEASEIGAAHTGVVRNEVPDSETPLTDRMLAQLNNWNQEQATIKTII
jgi:hypothetical protein